LSLADTVDHISPVSDDQNLTAPGSINKYKCYVASRADKDMARFMPLFYWALCAFFKNPRKYRKEIMADNQLAKSIAAGAAAGLASTVAIQGLMAASKQVAPETLPPIRQDPGEFMVEQAEKLLAPETREKVPELAEKVAATTLAFGYGMTAGILYSMLRPNVKNILVEGTALGLATWAAGYLGWLPALDLMPSLNEQTAKQIVGPVISHAIFGIATVAAYRWLTDRI
jgi:hypothetical protein